MAENCLISHQLHPSRCSQQQIERALELDVPMQPLSMLAEPWLVR